eukprot:5056954-Prymnesium_polylepis.1
MVASERQPTPEMALHAAHSDTEELACGLKQSSAHRAHWAPAFDECLPVWQGRHTAAPASG